MLLGTVDFKNKEMNMVLFVDKCFYPGSFIVMECITVKVKIMVKFLLLTLAGH